MPMLESTVAQRGWFLAVQKKIQVQPGERRVLLLAFGYFFCLLACYYVLRPVRDEMGVRSGIKNLPWLFTATFLVSLAMAPVYAAVVARWRRRTFLAGVYGFLALNILAFWALLASRVAAEATAMVFFVWLSVFNVFAVSVFWSFMADVFSSTQAKRLYPTIAAGGSLGGLAGSATVTGLAGLIGPANLLLAAAVLLVLALVCALRLDGSAATSPPVTPPASQPTAPTAAADPGRMGGGFLAGLTLLARSSYLSGIALWVLLLSLGGTFAYNMQNDIVGRAALDSATRTQIFGAIDLAANLLNPLLQLTLTRWMLQRAGTGLALGVIAAVFAAGFAVMSAAPVLGVLVAFMVAQRTGQFAISNPARESLFTVVGREEKYKAKNVIDNAVFRGSDVATVWLFSLLHTGAGLGLPAIALLAAPVMALWFGLSLALGRAASRRAAAASSSTAQGDHA
jgi:AAA family ATP:ADP antiporter